MQLNLHNNPYPTFENRVCIALAAGHLVISEPLSPTHGLQPGVDYLQVESPLALVELAAELAAHRTLTRRCRRPGAARPSASELRTSIHSSFATRWRT